MINREELDKIRKPPTVLAAKNPRTGEEGYRVGLGVFYQVASLRLCGTANANYIQLHCLNMLRKVAYGEYYFREGNPMASMAKDRQKFRGQLGKYLIFSEQETANQLASQIPVLKCSARA
jgi:hypothetical protein